jgi:hypothetical protein
MQFGFARARKKQRPRGQQDPEKLGTLALEIEATVRPSVN